MIQILEMAADTVDQETVEKLYVSTYFIVLVLCLSTIVSSVYTTGVLIL